MALLRRVAACGSMVVAAWVTIAGCGSDLPDIDCSAEPAIPTYAEVELFATCSVCHASTATGSLRMGAPVGIDFDSHAAARASAEPAVEEVYAGNMPPAGIAATEAQKHQLYVWGLCGTPE